MAASGLRRAWMSRRRLGWLLFALWLLLVLPSLGLIVQTERQIKWEAYHQYRSLAEELALRINQRLLADVQNEDARSVGEYQFLTVGGDPSVSRLLQRSPLASYPPGESPPGLLGHFQVDADGSFSTPLLPPSRQQGELYGLSEGELQTRGQRSRELLGILARNELLGSVPKSADAAELLISTEGRTADSTLSGARRSLQDLDSSGAADSAKPDAEGSIASTDSTQPSSAQPSTATINAEPFEPAAPGAAPARAAPAPPTPMAQSAAPVAVKVDQPLGEQALQSSSFADRGSMEREEQAAEPQASINDVADISAGADASDYLLNQRGFDELQSSGKIGNLSKNNEYGRLDQLKLRQNYVDEAKASLDREAEPRSKKIAAAGEKSKQERAPRKEQVAEVADDRSLDEVLQALAEGRVRMFEGELDPFEFSLLGSGHGVLFRKVWRDGQRSIQGLLFDQAEWLNASIDQPFRASALAQMSDLLLVYRGEVLQVLRGGRGRSYVSAEQLQGEILLQTRLPAPYADLQLVWTINQLPAGPGARAVRWTGALLLGVLSVVFMLLYRLGGRQIDLARQQQDFVSAVSHELKTPLTSIRMYGELLLQGWASEDKKREYYGFIHDESERLSRLIGNVLQLARMERNELKLKLESRPVASLIDLARSKLEAQVERAGFVLNIELADDVANGAVEVDSDAWLQILINLVDNALKFSAHGSNKRVDLQVMGQGKNLCMRVRDYGPGVPKDQLQKIFRLFYRVGSELTRETVGTGIGLALARQLAQAMHGELDVRNRQPGAEFELRLPLLAVPTSA